MQGVNHVNARRELGTYAVREESDRCARLEDLVKRPVMQKAELHQPCGSNGMRVQVDRAEVDAGLAHRDAFFLHLRHEVIDGLRFRCEGPRDGERPRHVRGVAVPFAPGIETEKLAPFQRLVVGHVVESACVLARSGDDAVCLSFGLPRDTRRGEDGLHLGFVLEVLDATKHVEVCLG